MSNVRFVEIEGKWNKKKKPIVFLSTFIAHNNHYHHQCNDDLLKKTLGFNRHQLVLLKHSVIVCVGRGCFNGLIEAYVNLV